MTREDLFCELSDVVFALAPASGSHEEVTKEDVEDVRRKLVDRLDRCAMRVAMDAEFTAEDEADMRQQGELDEASSEVGRD